MVSGLGNLSKEACAADRTLESSSVRMATPSPARMSRCGGRGSGDDDGDEDDGRGGRQEGMDAAADKRTDGSSSVARARSSSERVLLEPGFAIANAVRAALLERGHSDESAWSRRRDVKVPPPQWPATMMHALLMCLSMMLRSEGGDLRE